MAATGCGAGDREAMLDAGSISDSAASCGGRDMLGLFNARKNESISSLIHVGRSQSDAGKENQRFLLAAQIFG